MFYTSYFANKKLKDFPLDRQVSIALSPPPFFKGLRWDCFYPTSELLKSYKNKEIDEREYTLFYLENIVGKIDPIIFKNLGEIENYVLLCYESPKAFCHRHIVRYWMNKAGIPCEELV